MKKGDGKPGRARSHLQIFDTLPRLKSEIKNGHVLYLYLNSDRSVEDTVKKIIMEFFPLGTDRPMEIISFVNDIVSRFVKFKKLSNSSEFVRFTVFCQETFNTQSSMQITEYTVLSSDSRTVKEEQGEPTILEKVEVLTEKNAFYRGKRCVIESKQTNDSSAMVDTLVLSMGGSAAEICARTEMNGPAVSIEQSAYAQPYVMVMGSRPIISNQLVTVANKCPSDVVGERGSVSKFIRVDPTDIREGVGDVCGMDCPGLVGTPPSLHCSACFCLFHSACVGLSGVLNRGFICATCIELSGHTPPEASGRRNASQQLNNQNTPTRVAPTRVVPPRNVGGSGASKQALSGHALTLPPAVVHSLCPGKDLTLIVNGQRIKVRASMLIRTTDGVKFHIPGGLIPNGPVSNESTRQITITHNHKDPQVVTVKHPDFPLITPRSLSSIENISDDDDALTSVETTVAYAQKPAGAGVRTPPAGNHFQRLSAGYDVLPRIFHQLSASDLAAAARVCRVWRGVLRQSSSWIVVRLAGCLISDWPSAADHMQHHGTRALDVRRMRHPEGDSGGTWPKLTASLASCTSLTEITLGECQAAVVQAVAAALPHLTSLSAESIMPDEASPVETTARDLPLEVMTHDDVIPTDIMADDAAPCDVAHPAKENIISVAPGDHTRLSRLDVSVLAQLHRLRHLRLHCVSGLQLAGDGLDTLTGLHTLHLTSVRGAAWSFLSHLSCVRRLAAGRCDTWGPDTYGALGHLAQLSELRLEYGGGGARLADSLHTLTQLRRLELVSFTVDQPLCDGLKRLSQLTSLCVSPDTSSHGAAANSRTLEAVSALASLDTLDWGVLHQGDELEFLAALNVDDGGATPTCHVTLSELAHQLRETLSATKVRVFKVPRPSST